ncbi:hypothetical protein BDZ94DRAFT_1030697 [Collybia nuda]|uniref:Secreted protein n=1 Tax=Collybia nuda TaxID=64659 RepID=A0A9P5YGA4_9AGAR|nr:hypothetical protein BDZ94DRAFT_1030697 [Collybia nuda]
MATTSSHCSISVALLSISSLSRALFYQCQTMYSNFWLIKLDLFHWSGTESFCGRDIEYRIFAVLLWICKQKYFFFLRFCS